jgi:hypothetical protein
MNKKDCFSGASVPKPHTTPRQSCDATQRPTTLSDKASRAHEAQADVWAEEVKELTDAQLLTHEEIGRAGLRFAGPPVVSWQV